MAPRLKGIASQNVASAAAKRVATPRKAAGAQPKAVTGRPSVPGTKAKAGKAAAKRDAAAAAVGSKSSNPTLKRARSQEALKQQLRELQNEEDDAIEEQADENAVGDMEEDQGDEGDEDAEEEHPEEDVASA